MGLMRLISWYSVSKGCLTTSGGFGEVTSWFLENRGSYIRKAVYSLPDTSNFVQPKIARNNRQFGFESNESNISMLLLTSVKPTRGEGKGEGLGSSQGSSQSAVTFCWELPRERSQDRTS